MGVAVNNIFKILSLRGPIQLSEEAIAGVEPTKFFKELDDRNPDPANPDEKLADIVNRNPPISKAKAEVGIVAKLHRALGELKKCTVDELETLKFGQKENEKLTLKELIASEDFKKEMSILSDSWLAVQLGIALNKKGSPKKTPVALTNAASIDLIESLLKAGWLVQRYVHNIDSLRSPGTCKQILNLNIVYPRHWRTTRYQRMKVEEFHKKKAIAETKENSKNEDIHKPKIEAVKQKRNKLLQEIRNIESIQKKASLVYSELFAETQKKWRESEKSRTQREKGPVFGKTEAKEETTELPSFEPPKADKVFEKKLTNSLTGSEKETYKGVSEMAAEGVGIEVGEKTFSYEEYAANWEILWWNAIREANDLCSEIQVWEEESTRPDTRRPPNQINELNRPSVKAIGFGELIIARERLIGYEANEIAHIENVLPHEDRLREHERTTSREIVTETETLEESKSEKHLETTDRYELKTQSEKAIHEEFSINAGVNTSGKYGLTTIEASLEAEFSRSVDESHSSTSNLAKEVVSRAVEETHKSARELRRVTVTEQIKELNRHGINFKDESDPFSGVYYWVKKIHEVELRHYGTRLMVEFYIPEPGLSLLPKNNKETLSFKKPAPLAIGPSDIKAGNYLCLARKYGVSDIEPPPPPKIQVGYKWASTPDPKVKRGVDTASETITIPDGYVPISATATCIGKWFGSPGGETEINILLAIGGNDIVAHVGNKVRRESILLEQIPAPDGLPVTIRVTSHRNKTATVNVRVDCQRTEAAIDVWRLRVFGRLKEAYELMVAEYERKMAQAEIRGGIEISGRHSTENRAREIDELKKWAIKTMRVSTFDFDAVVQELGQQEIDPVRSDEYAPIVRFFEEGFEWRQMSYFLYPYYWGRRDSYGYRHRLEDSDNLHRLFMRAGGARVVVPVTPGFEERILHYLDTPGDEEMKRVTWQPPPQDELSNEPPISEAEDVWIEVLMNKNADVQRGTGTLNVKKDDDVVIINSDSVWYPDSRDLGRELYIAGDVYTVTEVIISTIEERRIRIDPPYKLDGNTSIRYAAGSVPIGSPWVVRLPTSLVILSDQKNKLKINIDRKQYG